MFPAFIPAESKFLDMRTGLLQDNNAVLTAIAEDVGVDDYLKGDAVGKANVIRYLLFFIID